MKFVFYTNSISPHQLPLARELIRIFGEDGYRYIYTKPFTEERRNIGWSTANEKWIIAEFEQQAEARRTLEEADIVLSAVRDWDLFELRAKRGLLSIYTAERWCKPPIGILRFLTPTHFCHAWRLAKLMRTTDKVLCFPIGIHAAMDMVRLCGLVHGNLRCLFRTPRLEIDGKPGGRIGLKNGADNKECCLDKMRIWGYYVEPSKGKGVWDAQPPTNHYPLTTIKVLWVGRLLNWKRVDTIVRAVGEHAKLQRVNASLPTITLDIYGGGPAEAHLRKVAAQYGDAVTFHPPVPIDEVRRLMREHDVYVLASNGYEGWGAVVSEALEEGMKVLGTYEAGSSATMLPEENLFHVGDWKTLEKLLSNGSNPSGIGAWTASSAATFIQRLKTND